MLFIVQFTYFNVLMTEQRGAVTVRLEGLDTSRTHVTRFTEIGAGGSQQSTVVCRTTPVWQSSMMTSSRTFPKVN